MESEAKKAAKEDSSSSSSDSSSSDSSDSDSDSDDEKKVETKKESSESSSSDDDSSSDEEEEAKAAPAKSKAVVKKDSSSSSSDSSDSSDSDSSDDEDDKKKADKMVVDKKSSASDSSSSDSDSDGDSDSTKASVPPVDNSSSKKRKAEDETFEAPIKKQAVAADGDDGCTKLYIRGLPWRATEEGIKEFFQACGSGPSAIELPLQEDGRSSGTAIVDFHDAASAAAALELNGGDYEGRWLSIKYSTPKPINAPRQVSEKQDGCCTIFVGNLSWDVDEDSLRAAFADCGTITQVRFSTDRETGDFKG
jgi:nucleolin